MMAIRPEGEDIVITQMDDSEGNVSRRDVLNRVPSGVLCGFLVRSVQHNYFPFRSWGSVHYSILPYYTLECPMNWTLPVEGVLLILWKSILSWVD